MTANTYPHIHPNFVDVLNRSDDERIAFMDEPRWIGYPRANDIIEHMRGMLNKPTRPRMQNLLIVGESNNGKTTIVDHFGEMYGKGYVNGDSEPVRPVIIAEAPASADEKGLHISILERFATPYRPSDPVAKLRYQVIHLMRECHVRMLIIDELHSLLAGTAGKQREVMNAIKLLCNELRIPIVGVGTIDAVRILHTDPQHASRFEVAKLPKWKLDKDFLRLVVSFEKTLPLRKASNLASREKLPLIHSICSGNIGDLHRLLIECAKEAILSGKEEIDVEIIKSKKWVQPTKGIREIFS
ncbi:MAG: transposase [Gammaproteobacteria bacterium]|nr:MAG: transposase [Gammaproteobacteria bacterium]